MVQCDHGTLLRNVEEEKVEVAQEKEKKNASVQ